MANIVNSLFNLTPTDVLAQRRQEQQANALALSQLRPKDMGTYIGAQIGQSLGQGALNLFGIEDPQLARAKKIESVLNEVQAGGFEDPVQMYSTLADRLSENGLVQEAMMVRQQALAQGIELRKANSEILKNQAQTNKYIAETDKAKLEGNLKKKTWLELAKKSSPESVAKSEEAGYDISLLDVPENVKRSSFAQQLIEAGYEEGSPEFKAKMKEFIAAEVKGKEKGSGNTSVSVSIDSGKVGEEAGKVVGKDVGSIEGKYQAIDSIRGARDMVKSGIYSGLLGPAGKFVAKATRGEVGDMQKVERTERFMSYIGNIVIPRLQEFGGNDSVEELRYLQQVMAGDITLEADSIDNILKDAEIAIQRGIERTQRQVDSAGKGEAPPLDPGPSREKPKKVYNPETGKVE